MPVNLELKIKTYSHVPIIKILKKHKVEETRKLKQKDIYYSYKKGLLKLRIENGSFYLIKYLRDEVKKRWSNYEILKLEGKNPEKYLSTLFNTEVVVKKVRRLFIYKNTRIHLDKVEGLGDFLELETVVREDKRKASKEFKEVVELLKLDLSKQINASYKNLLTK